MINFTLPDEIWTKKQATVYPISKYFFYRRVFQIFCENGIAYLYHEMQSIVFFKDDI